VYLCQIMRKTFVILLFVLIALASCQEKVEYPVEPHITYNGIAYLMNADSTLTGEVVLSINYTDGDGDLGLDDADTLYPFGPNDPHYYNLLIDYIGPTDSLNFNARFKRLIFNDEVAAISGTINDTIMLRNPFSPHDTVSLKVHIIDRALHESNTIQTENITF